MSLKPVPCEGAEKRAHTYSVDVDIGVVVPSELKQRTAAISSVIGEPCCLIDFKEWMKGAVGIFTVVLMGE